jgi:hypothetical protein
VIYHFPGFQILNSKKNIFWSTLIGRAFLALKYVPPDTLEPPKTWGRGDPSIVLEIVNRTQIQARIIFKLKQIKNEMFCFVLFCFVEVFSKYF